MVWNRPADREESIPALFSGRRSVSAVEERGLLCVDEPRAGADGLEFHRAKRCGDVLAVEGHRVRHHDAPVRHDIEIDRLVAGLGAVAAAKSPLFTASDAEVEPVLLDLPALALCKPLALGRRVAPRCEYEIRWPAVRALGDDGVVNNGSFGHVLSRFSARYFRSVPSTAPSRSRRRSHRERRFAIQRWATCRPAGSM